MPEDNNDPRTRLQAQIRLILDQLEGAAAWPPNWAERNYVDYLYRERSLVNSSNTTTTCAA